MDLIYNDVKRFPDLFKKEMKSLYLKKKSQ